jgi:flagellar motor switch protein FliG
MAAPQISGTQKVAILLLQIGRENAAKVMRVMRDQEVAEITAEIARQTAVRREDADAVLEEFHQMTVARDQVIQGGLLQAKDMLVAAYGQERTEELLGSLATVLAEHPFAFLDKADPKQVLNALRDENPQTIAVVLAHARPDQAGMVMSSLPTHIQQEVALRLVKMERPSKEWIQLVEASLERRLSGVLTSTPSSDYQIGGVTGLADILNAVDKSTERAVFEGLESVDPEVAAAVQSKLFTFEDLAELDSRSLQLVLARATDNGEVALALKTVAEEVKNTILAAVSSNRRALIEDELRTMGQKKLSDVEAAQSSIVRIARSLEEEGDITLVRGGSDLLV